MWCTGVHSQFFFFISLFYDSIVNSMLCGICPPLVIGTMTDTTVLNPVISVTICVAKITSVRVDSELSEEFEVKVWMHQGSVLSPFLSAVVVDVVTEFARGCAK